MGKSVNKVTLLGRLGRDPELKYTASGTPFCRFSVATDESWTDKASGEKKTAVEWHNISCWDKLAEIANQYLKKGDQVYLEGKLQTREWDDQEGNKRKTTEINMKEMTLLGSKGGNSQAAGAAPPAGGPAGQPFTDDDVPF
jgi:single-strand DNA-binding protein